MQVCAGQCTSGKLFKQPLKEDARCPRASEVAQWVKNQLAVQEMPEIWIRSLDQEDPLEEGMVTHSSIPAWRAPWTEEPGGLQSLGSQRGEHEWNSWAHHKQVPRRRWRDLPGGAGRQRAWTELQIIRWSQTEMVAGPGGIVEGSLVSVRLCIQVSGHEKPWS